MSWTLKKKLRVQARSRGGRWCRWTLKLATQSRRDQEEGGGAGLETDILLSLQQFFPNGGATDIVFVTLFCTAVGTAFA